MSLMNERDFEISMTLTGVMEGLLRIRKCGICGALYGDESKGVVYCTAILITDEPCGTVLPQR